MGGHPEKSRWANKLATKLPGATRSIAKDVGQQPRLEYKALSIEMALLIDRLRAELFLARLGQFLFENLHVGRNPSRCQRHPEGFSDPCAGDSRQTTRLSGQCGEQPETKTGNRRDYAFLSSGQRQYSPWSPSPERAVYPSL